MVFLPGRVIGKLTRDHDFHRHHRQLARHTRKFDQRFAKLLAVFGVFHRHFQRRLRHTYGAGDGLDAGGFKRLHQLLEPLARHAAQKGPM